MSNRRRRSRPVLWTLIAFLVLLLAGAGVIYWKTEGSDRSARSAAISEGIALEHSWQKPPTGTPGQGDAFAILHIHSIGLTYPIRIGTDTPSINRGIGWYSNTAAPGKPGNCALTGYRVTHGSPFRRLLELKIGDEVAIHTREAIYVYKIVVAPSELTVDKSASWVLDSTPGHPGVQPAKPLLTLITAQDLVATGERSVGFAQLEETLVK